MSFEQKEWKNRLSENPTRRLLTPTDGGTAMTVDVTRAEGTVMQQGDPFNADNMNDLERRIAEGIGGGEDIIAPSEQEISENAYAIGDKLIFDGILYKVISPIAVGNSLVPNVNIEETTVSSLINVIEDELTANGNRMYLDYKDGKYGINTDPERGADTFIPFKSNEYDCTILYSGTGAYTFTEEYDFAVASAANGDHSSWMPNPYLTVSNCTLVMSRVVQTNYGRRDDGPYGFDGVVQGLIKDIRAGSVISRGNANTLVVFGFKFP